MPKASWGCLAEGARGASSSIGPEGIRSVFGARNGNRNWESCPEGQSAQSSGPHTKNWVGNSLRLNSDGFEVWPWKFYHDNICPCARGLVGRVGLEDSHSPAQ